MSLKSINKKNTKKIYVHCQFFRNLWECEESKKKTTFEQLNISVFSILNGKF